MAIRATELETIMRAVLVILAMKFKRRRRANAMPANTTPMFLTSREPEMHIYIYSGNIAESELICVRVAI